MADHSAASPVVAHPQVHGEHGHDEHGHEDLMLVGHDGQLHPAHLQHHFVSAEQQFAASKLGMWLFLVTEILLFGGMFVAYAIFRAWYPELYEEASTQLDTVLGAFNTLVLLTSSLTVAWAIRGAQMDHQKVLFWNLVATVALAGTFMVVKYFEYTHKFDLGIYPGKYFVLEEGTTTVSGEEVQPLLPAGAEAAPEGATPVGDEAEAVTGDHGEAAPTGEGDHAEEGEHGAHAREGAIFSDPRAGIFFSIYYVMTGIHGLHVIIGMIAISILAWQARRGRYSSVYYTPVENVGLYWHVVDIIWIFLFPLMYLI
jgi:cytochrome c oxidase subunit 3